MGKKKKVDYIEKEFEQRYEETFDELKDLPREKEEENDGKEFEQKYKETLNELKDLPRETQEEKRRRLIT